MISVTIHKPDVDLAAQWDDLVSRAQPNVFMNPVALKAAADTMLAVIHVLLAWEMGLEEPKLIGLWALQERRPFPLWPKILEALPYDYAFLSNPVVDQAYVTQVVPAFLAAIHDAPDLPKTITLRSLDGEALTYESLMCGLKERGGRSVTLKSESRPYARRETFAQQSGTRRKKLRQSWRRLNEIGPTEVLHFTTPADISTGLEAFLTLEYESWKGTAGTALLCRDADAAFARRLVPTLAARGEAAIHALKVDGRLIAVQVVFFCGSVAYTWKTGFDEAFSRFSPGVTLIDRSIDGLFAMVGVDAIDSCSIETSFMAKICNDRRAILDLLIDVGPRTSVVFGVEAVRLKGREGLKRLRDRVQIALADRKAGKTVSKAEVETRPVSPSPRAPDPMKPSFGTDAVMRMTETSPPLAVQDTIPDHAVVDPAHQSAEPAEAAPFPSR